MYTFFGLTKRMNQSSKFLCLLLLLTIPIKSAHAKVNFERPYDEAVSLGNMCQAAQQLNDNGIRHKSYPFDWIVTSPNGIINFILYKGEGFLDLDKIVLGDFWAGTNYITTTDSRYGFQLLHDFYAPFESCYATVKEKYDRRKERFFNLLKSNKKILFVRMQMTREKAILLDHTLHALYPKLTYTILVLNPEPQVDWGLERVKNFQLIQNGLWYGDHAQWKAILSQFPVKPAQDSPPFWTTEAVVGEKGTINKDDN